ncbi:Saccharopine dehydrogenase-domain-containing protein [Trametes punicea]|nr:Saccharopine dehydrogenase-domain-containing protein [Trametes punicea]
MVDLLIVGATGFTGRLVTRYLNSHPQRASYTLALGVRSKSKGEALKQNLRLADDVGLVQLDVARYDQVEAAVKDAKVVINAVGPYWKSGEGVVRACAVHGKKYVDFTGEVHFIRNIIIHYDYLATTTGAIIVPACGLDSVPADLMVHLSNKTLKRALGPDVELGLSETFYSVDIKFSGGSHATRVSNLTEGARKRMQEARTDYALSPVHGAPSPDLHTPKPIPFSSPPKYGTFYLMAYIDRAIVQRTFGLNQLMRHASRTLYGDKRAKESEAQFRMLAYGPQFRYAEYLVDDSGSYVWAWLFSWFMFIYRMLLTLAPIRWLYEKVSLKPGEGPSDEEIEKGSFTATNYTVTASRPETWAKTVVRGQGDAAYLLTALMTAECALGLLLEDDSLPVTARPGGVLTPATALGEVLVRRLQATGKMQFESEIVTGGEESRKER